MTGADSFRQLDGGPLVSQAALEVAHVGTPEMLLRQVHLGQHGRLVRLVGERDPVQGDLAAQVARVDPVHPVFRLGGEHVAQATQPGYRRGEQLFRPARVIVAQ